MTQEFQVLRCCQCNTFQSHQVKKAKKWTCKMCGQKQSYIKVYGCGSGADCRRHVQKLNMTRGQIEDAQPLGRSTPPMSPGTVPPPPPTVHPGHTPLSTSQKQPVAEESQPGSRWGRYLETNSKTTALESTDDGDDSYTTDRRQFEEARKGGKKRWRMADGLQTEGFARSVSRGHARQTTKRQKVDRDQDNEVTWGDRNQGPTVTWGDRNQGPSVTWGDRNQGPSVTWGDVGDRNQGPSVPWGDRNQGPSVPWGDRNQGPSVPWGDRNQGPSVTWGDVGDRNQDPNVPWGDRNQGPSVTWGDVGDRNQDLSVTCGDVGDRNQDLSVTWGDVGDRNQDLSVTWGDKAVRQERFSRPKTDHKPHKEAEMLGNQSPSIGDSPTDTADQVRCSDRGSRCSRRPTSYSKWSQFLDSPDPTEGQDDSQTDPPATGAGETTIHNEHGLVDMVTSKSGTNFLEDKQVNEANNSYNEVAPKQLDGKESGNGVGQTVYKPSSLHSPVPTGGQTRGDTQRGHVVQPKFSLDEDLDDILAGY